MVKKIISVVLLSILSSVSMAATKTIPDAGLLRKAASDGDKKMIEKLISEGVDVDAQDSEGYPAFVYALNSEHSEIALLLLKNVKKIDAKIGIGRESYLLISIQNNCGACVDYILERDPKQLKQADENDFTPLMVAARKSNVQIVKSLLAAGADRYLKNKFGKTALDIAVKAKNSEVVKLLQTLSH